MAWHFRQADYMKSFGDRLRAARIAAGMTQEQLGFALGVTKSSVSAWENDREAPGFRLLPPPPAEYTGDRFFAVPARSVR